MLSEKARALWAKSADESGWLALVQHLADSKEVAGVLWTEWVPDHLRSFIAESLSLDLNEVRKLVGWLSATHDIGKASRSFQSLLFGRPDQGCILDGIRSTGAVINGWVLNLDYFHHAAASEVLIARWLHELVGQRVAKSLAAVAGAHHGLPLPRAEFKRVRIKLEGEGAYWAGVQQEILDYFGQKCEIRDVLVKLAEKNRFGLSYDLVMVLSGLVIMVDWIASNSDLFPYSRSGLSTNPDRLGEGWSKIGLPHAWHPTRPFTGNTDELYRDRFGWPDHFAPRPVQRVIAERFANGSEEPEIVVIEAKMGDGKTEAALMASEILARRCGSGGLFVGEPTTATSNALLPRVRRWAEVVGDETVTSIYLAHSRRHLNSEWNDITRESMADYRVYEDECMEQGADSSGSVTAHQWLSGRKKGMLSTIVVGTVDQVLLMALQSKHLMLRHVGLAGKVVLIDEVHAYDAYMSSYLERALYWLGLYRCPVILLSATLPQATRESLVSSYLAGLGVESSDTKAMTPGTAYPLVTRGTPGGVEYIPVEDEQESQDHELWLIGDGDDELLETLQPVVEEGGCALIVCNTVARAQHAYRLIASIVGDDVKLLHSNLIACDRATLEEDLVAELGPGVHRGEGRPLRRIVVATQVVEQSLDLDFDMMVTDIAPIDLVLQRIGRCHRHARPETDRPEFACVPRTFIRGVVEWSDDVEAPTFDRIIEYIYPRALLLTSMSHLRPFLIGENRLRIPDDLSPLVQAAYCEDPKIIESWRSVYSEARETFDNDRHDQRIRSNAFRLGKPHEATSFSDLWSMDATTPEEDAGVTGASQVRDADPTIEVVVTQSLGDGTYRPMPWILDGGEDLVCFREQLPGARIERALAESVVKLPLRFSRDVETFDRVVRHLEGNTDPAWRFSTYLKQQVELSFDEDFRAELDGYELIYDRDLGLINNGKKGN